MADEIEPVETPETETPISDAPVSEAVETETVEAPEPAAPPEPDYFAIAKEKAGVDFSGKYKTSDDLWKGIGELSRRVGQKTQLERLGEEAARNWTDYQAFLQSRQNPPQPQHPVEQPQNNYPLWQPPEVKPSDKRWVEPDPDNPGASRIKPNAPHEVRQRLETYAAARDEYLYALENNPQQVWQSFGEQIRQQTLADSEQRILQILQEREQAQQRQFTLQRITSEREKAIFQLDANGRRIADGATGFPTPTEYGRHYITKVKQLESAGIYDPATQDALASEYADLHTRLAASPGTKPAPSSKPGAASAKNNTAGRSPSTGGAPKHSLAAMLLEDNKDVPDDVMDLSIV